MEMLQLNSLINSNNLKISTVCIPKTIDNDIPLIDRSFGFETSVAKTVEVIRHASLEASCTPDCISIVRIFGRGSGFTALHATNSSRDVDVCLIPEQKINIYGEYGLLSYVLSRVKVQGHCVMLVSEGIAYSILDKPIEPKDVRQGLKDQFGNKVYPDIGKQIRDELQKYAKTENIYLNNKKNNMKYKKKRITSQLIKSKFSLNS